HHPGQREPAGQQRGELREGEGEDQVEEQFQGAHPQRDAVARVIAGPVRWRAGLPVRWRAGCGGHGLRGQGPADGTGAYAAASAMSWRYQPPRILMAPAARYATSRAAARSGPVPTTFSTRPPA